MEKFNSGEKLIKDFGWEGFQYFECLQKGLLQPHDLDTGHRIIDLNTEYGKKIIETFEQTPPKTLEEYEKITRRREIRFREQHGGWIKSNKSLQKIKEKARILYTDRLLSLNNCIRGSFTLSRDRKEAKEQFREAKKWLFKEDKVLAFKKKHGLDRSSKHTANDLPESVIKPDLIKRKKHPKIQDLIINAMPELDELHQVLRKKVGFSIHITDRESKFQEVALRRFNENCNEFKYVKLEYLRDETLYNLYRPGQEKGDFIGKLLQKILKDHDLGVHGAQKCYNIYKATLKSKTDQTD